MWYLTKLAMKSRPITILLALLLTVVSVWGTLQLKMEMIPEIELPFTTVLTIYPNATPEEVADEISTPVEKAIWDDWNDKGLRQLFSTSADGVSVIFAEFEYGISMSKVNSDLADTIGLLDLPPEVVGLPQSIPQIEENPRVIPLNMDTMMPLLVVTLNGDLPPHELQEIANRKVVPVLQGIEGVYNVAIEAAAKDQVLIAPDPEKMSEFGISISQIMGMFLGSSEGTLPDFDSISHISNTAMMIDDVTLRDVANVGLGTPSGAAITRTNGKTSVVISISKLADANTVETANAVADKISEIEISLHEENGNGINLTTIFDQSNFIEDSIWRLTQMAMIGFALAAVIVFVFLMAFKASLITALSIPLSILIGFLMMHLTGVTINMLSLSAMAIAVGRLIDNSIVIVEVIYRRLQQGEGVTEAAINGAKEVATPITSSTLATVAIFIPIFFIGGMIKEFFMPFGLTIIFSLMASLLVALIVVPAFSGFFVNKKDNVKNSVADELKTAWYQKIYLSTLNWSLKHRLITLFLAGVLFFGSLGLIPMIGTSFMPQMSEKMLLVSVEMPSWTDLETTADVTGQVERLIDEEVSFVKNQYTTIGTSTSIEGAFNTAMGGGDNTAQIVVYLESEADMEKERSNLETSVHILQDQIEGVFIEVSDGSSAMSGFADVDISIQSDDESKLADITRLLHQRLEKIEGIENIDSQVTMVVPKFIIEADPLKLFDLDLSPEQQQQLQLEFHLLKTGGNIPMVSIMIDNEDYQVFIKEAASTAYRTSDPEKTASAIPMGYPVFATLGDTAHVQIINSPTHIDHIDLQPAASIRGAVSAKDVGAVNKLVQDEIDSLEQEIDTEGVEITMHGIAEEMAESFSSMNIAILAAIVIAYLIVAISLKSLLTPIIIMVSLPLSSIGALLALLISGYTLGISGMMGVLMLVGIVLTNAIVLIDLVEKLRRDGCATRESLLEAGRTRLRPILMTALTTMIAMVPLALGVGEGGIIAAELAVVVIGGLFSSTLLTILVIPVIYSLVDGMRQRVAGAK